MMSAAAALAEASARVRERLARAAAQAGRDPASVTLIAVSKTHPAELVRAAAQAGLRDFGENRVEEAAPKMAAVGRADLRWHMIGHIQSRKAPAVAEAGFALIHSVDTVKLAERLSASVDLAGARQPILLECNVSGEAAKTGFVAHDPADWGSLLEAWRPLFDLAGVQVRGLMTMAPLGTDHHSARPFFRRLRDLREAARQRWPQAEWAELSMGMTDDFEGAVAEGATLVRVGRALFGER